MPIDLAGVITAASRTYESYDLPKGTIRGSPAIPEDDLTTLRVPFYLVANKKLSDSAVAALAQTMMEVPRDLVGEYPLLAQISAPSSDKDATIPIHPGAATYFSGEQQSFLDKYADKLFYLFMLLGFFISMLAAAWKFMTKDAGGAEDAPLTHLTRLMDQIRTTNSEAELANAERDIDEILKTQLERYSRGQADAAERGALGLAIQRLERCIGQRRAGQGSPPRGAR